jgi:UDP-N-acetylglucosamine acyltransferase
MNRNIHPSAVVHPDANVGEGVRIGPFCLVEADVTLGAGTDLISHVTVHSHTHIGSNTKVHSGAVLGGAPQHLKYAGEPTTLEIGNDVIIRESVTCNRGTSFGGGRTVIGDGAMLMAYCHVAHDCIVGKKVIFANGVQLAGHVHIEDYVGIGGLSGVTQFCRVGAHSFIGANSLLRKDMPPFLIGQGIEDFQVRGLNIVGLERRGFSDVALKRLRTVYKIFYMRNLTVAQAIEQIVLELGKDAEVAQFLSFLEGSKNGILR